MRRAQSVVPSKVKPPPRLSRSKSAAPSKPKPKSKVQTREYSHATKSDEEEYVPKDKTPGLQLRTSTRLGSRSSRAAEPEVPFDPSPYLRRSRRAVSVAKVIGGNRSGVGSSLSAIVPSEDLPLDHEARKLWAIFVVRLRAVYRGQSDWSKVPSKVKKDLAEMISMVIAAVDA